MELTSIKEYVALEKARLKEKIVSSDHKYRLDIFQVGDNPASNSYIKGKIKDCTEVGIVVTVHKYEGYDDDDCTLTDKLMQDMRHALCEGSDGIILQLPVPEDIDSNYIIKEVCRVKPSADIDGFVYQNHNPCTPQGIIDWLEYNKVKIDGSDVVILGRSDIVGKPLARIMTDKNATVTLCHSHTNHCSIQKYCALADIVVSAVGRAGLLKTSSFINKDKIVIDVGINRNKDGKLCGDVLDDCHLKIYDHYVTPVPGGVGLLTRLRLLKNIVGE